MRPPCYVRREFVEVGRAGVEHASASDWPTAGTVVLKPAFLIRLLMGNNSHRDSLMRGENALRAIVLCFVVCYTDGVIPTTMGGYADGLLLLLLLLFYYYFFFNIYSLFVFHLFRSCLLFGPFLLSLYIPSFVFVFLFGRAERCSAVIVVIVPLSDLPLSNQPHGMIYSVFIN